MKTSMTLVRIIEFFFRWSEGKKEGERKLKAEFLLDFENRLLQKTKQKNAILLKKYLLEIE